jgi:Spy/CpxP family protein refolding chaperone
MKRTSAIITALILAIAFAVPASAQGFGLGRGRVLGNRVPWMGNRIHQGIVRDNLTAEQREKIQDAYKAFLDETIDLRNNLRAKHTELGNLLRTAEPDAEKAKAIQKEISDLQAKLAQRRIELRLEILKINPDARYGKGLGRRNMMRFADPE